MLFSPPRVCNLARVVARSSPVKQSGSRFGKNDFPSFQGTWVLEIFGATSKIPIGEVKGYLHSVPAENYGRLGAGC